MINLTKSENGLFVRMEPVSCDSGKMVAVSKNTTIELSEILNIYR